MMMMSKQVGMDVAMMNEWVAWLGEYGYTDGVDMSDMGVDDVRMMSSDYLDGCDEWGAEYDDSISADMIAWARR